jgi:hypothetical protein
MGRYHSGKPALGYKQCRDYISFYSATGNIPVGVLREISRISGVHIYYEKCRPVYVNSHLIGIHNTPNGEIVFEVPSGLIFEELFDGGEYQSSEKGLCLSLQKGESKLFLTTNGTLSY